MLGLIRFEQISSSKRLTVPHRYYLRTTAELTIHTAQHKTPKKMVDMDSFESCGDQSIDRAETRRQRTRLSPFSFLSERCERFILVICVTVVARRGRARYEPRRTQIL